MRNAPRFPQGKVVTSIPKIVRHYDMSPASVEKMVWANEQVSKAVRCAPSDSVAITVTNFDANPATMQNWLRRACKEMYPMGTKEVTFKFRGSRRNGTLYLRVVLSRKGKELTQRV